MSTTKLDTFTREYVTAMMFTEDTDPRQGEYQEKHPFCLENIAPDTLARIVADCAKFQADHWADISDDLEHAARDFWYTRNGHGCGFWDGDWPETIGNRLTEVCKQFGEFDIYIGDDGVIYGQ